MAHVAIIPARGGSKRLPGKNIKELGGKPLIAWTIEAALASQCFDVVLVSTDDEGIATVAREYGAYVPFLRPAELARDTSTSDEVIQHAVEWLESMDELTVESVALLQPTSPFRSAVHIREAFELKQAKKALGVVSVMPCETRLELCNTLPENHSLAGFIQVAGKRTQDMRQLYELNGAIYLFDRTVVGHLAKLYATTSSACAYVMPVTASVDIDERKDFLWAEFCLQSGLAGEH